MGMGMAPHRDDSISVLVVDDHEVVRRGPLAFLDGEPDIDVVGQAAGGAQALALLAAMEAGGRRPDVVVMDLQMEPIDGIESTRRIRALYEDVEVVALTSFADEERVHAALQAGPPATCSRPPMPTTWQPPSARHAAACCRSIRSSRAG